MKAWNEARGMLRQFTFFYTRLTLYLVLVTWTAIAAFQVQLTDYVNRVLAVWARWELDTLLFALPALMFGMAVDSIVALRRTEKMRLEGTLVQRTRERLAADLHDDIGQRLAALNFIAAGMAESLKWREDAPSVSARDRAGQISAIAADVSAKIRRLASANSEDRTFGTNLRTSLRHLAEQVTALFAVDCRVVEEQSASAHGFYNNHAQVEIENIYRIAQEAATNAVRHGAATQIEFRMSASPVRDVLSLWNNGIAFDPGAVKRGLGLDNMEDRVSAIQAKLEFRVAQAGDVEVCIYFPKRRSRAWLAWAGPLPGSIAGTLAAQTGASGAQAGSMAHLEAQPDSLKP